MKFCPNCEAERASAFDMGNDGQIVEQCAVCTFRMPKDAPVEPTGAVAAKPVPVVAKQLERASNVVDIESHMRARLASIEVEIERANGLRDEAKRLRRMLRAAESKR